MFNLPELADFLSSLLPTIHSAKYFICSININIHKTCCKGIQLVWELVKSERKRHEHINRSFPWTVEETTHFICLLGSKKKGPNKEAWQVPYSSKPKLVKVQVYFYRGLQEKKNPKKNTINKQKSQTTNPAAFLLKMWSWSFTGKILSFRNKRNMLVYPLPEGYNTSSVKIQNKKLKRWLSRTYQRWSWQVLIVIVC